MMQKDKIFIYGAPGAGKTTFSVELQKKLGWPLVEGDYLREVMAQKEKTEAEDPFVYVGTKEAYRKFGELTEENVIKGLQAVRKSMAPYVEREVTKYPEKLILEAAFLDPWHLVDRGRLILVVTQDISKHEEQYFQHRERTQIHNESFQAARIIQDHLMQEADKYSVVVIDNDADASIVVSKFLEK